MKAMTTTGQRARRVRRWLREAAEDMERGAGVLGGALVEVLGGPRLVPVPVPVYVGR